MLRGTVSRQLEAVWDVDDLVRKDLVGRQYSGGDA